MLQTMTFEQFEALSRNNSLVVVSKEIFGDSLTPVRAFRLLSKGLDSAVLLDSSDHDHAEDACVYMGFDPLAEFQGDSIEGLREFYLAHKAASLKTIAKLAGGMIGYLAYDAVRFIEDIPDSHNNEAQIPDALFTFYGTHVVFDKRTGLVTIAKVVRVSDDPLKTFNDAMKAIDQTVEKMHENESKVKLVQNDIEADCDDFDVDVSDARYMKMVELAKSYIAKGEAFQIVPSRRFTVKYQGDDFNIYRALRVLNPSPYQFYIRHKDFTIVGASPERLVSLQNGVVETMPIAGTRPRGETHQQDCALEQELLNDEKEIAEHMMLVDLGRNDLGSISVPGSVTPVDLAQIKRYSKVMHIVSRVQGRIQKGFDAFDVLKAGFPAGTLSGAPKIRAMEIIDEIETSRRGVYGGAIVAIDNAGQMDSCITIRTALIKDGVATVRAGGGVVVDSDPKKEAQETYHKARAVLKALHIAQKGLI